MAQYGFGVWTGWWYRSEVLFVAAFYLALRLLRQAFRFVVLGTCSASISYMRTLWSKGGGGGGNSFRGVDFVSELIAGGQHAALSVA